MRGFLGVSFPPGFVALPRIPSRHAAEPKPIPCQCVRRLKAHPEAPHDGMPTRKRRQSRRTAAVDLAELGRLTSQGLRKLGAIVRESAAKRRLPENLQRLVAAIEGFQPTKRYRRELQYHMELSGWLKARYGAVEIEETRGRSRPDIVVSRVIAIEVKGPTTNRELKTIADKVIRYRQYYEAVVVVLFDVQDEQRYAEWKKGMESRFPEVVVIRK